MPRYTHITVPPWMKIHRGEPIGTEHKYIRIDKVWIRCERGNYPIEGCIVVICDNEYRTRRTVYGHTMVDGPQPIWLLKQNGLGGLLETTPPKAAAAVA